jgi:7,8-dihydroneopterin aldolase/epimerase/oxygenase
MDRIGLHGLRIRGFHGVLPHERVEGQTFVVDVEMGVDSRPAAASDELAKTVHYGIVAEEVAAVVSSDPCDLIETLAQRIADQCLTHEAVREVVGVHQLQRWLLSAHRQQTRRLQVLAARRLSTL